MVKKTKLRDVNHIPSGQEHVMNKQDLFMPYEAPEWVAGDDHEPYIANDSVFIDQFRNFNITNNPMTTLFEEGIGFPGYPYLSQLALRGEYRVIVETRAEEATRAWIKLTASTAQSLEKAQDRLDHLQSALIKFDIQGLLRKSLCNEGYFGASHIYIDLKTASNDAEEKTAPLFLTSKKINKGDLKGFKLVDPNWVTPVQYNTIDPFDDYFYQPSMWWVLGQQIHASRLMTMVSQPVPDLLKPAYNFGGVPFAFMCKPYVDNWLRTRQSVADLIKSFSTMILKTDLSQLLSPGCEELSKRAELMAAYRDNRGLQIVDKESEDLLNIATPLSGLDKLQAQSQEHMAAISGIPLVKLLGITPSGLNASSDGEIRCFYDKISALQEAVLRRPLQTILDVLQLHLFGDIDETIEFEFNSLWQLDEVQQSQVELNTAQTVKQYADTNALNKKQIQQIISQKQSPFMTSFEPSKSQ